MENLWHCWWQAPVHYRGLFSLTEPGSTTAKRLDPSAERRDDLAAMNEARHDAYGAAMNSRWNSKERYDLYSAEHMWGVMTQKLMDGDWCQVLMDLVILLAWCVLRELCMLLVAWKITNRQGNCQLNYLILRPANRRRHQPHLLTLKKKKKKWKNVTTRLVLQWSTKTH